ncbi:putative transcription factor TFIIIB component B'' [Blattamonas nauphoetae]|uniref:Transcription factor TFIIIB component B n=1 Tax=Blattamonas nauphoetae TaxID=2049346 RepID=A0ABQ9YMD7_9EUKA|nr:putative transcription factor TFIIIB component B'' [Blattamonas nauphoetae]
MTRCVEIDPPFNSMTSFFDIQVHPPRPPGEEDTGEEYEEKNRKQIPINQLLKTLPTENPTSRYAQHLLTIQKLKRTESSNSATTNDDRSTDRLTPLHIPGSTLAKTFVQADPQRTQTPAPSIRIVDGRIEVDHVPSVGTPNAAGQRMDLQYAMEEEHHLTSHAHLKREATKNWSENETVRFYELLSQFGSNFDLINKLFPERSVTQLKRKFHHEDRVNHDLINAALNHRCSVEQIRESIRNMQTIRDNVKQEKQTRLAEIELIERQMEKDRLEAMTKREAELAELEKQKLAELSASNRVLVHDDSEEGDDSQAWMEPDDETVDKTSITHNKRIINDDDDEDEAVEQQLEQKEEEKMDDQHRPIKPVEEEERPMSFFDLFKPPAP